MTSLGAIKALGRRCEVITADFAKPEETTLVQQTTERLGRSMFWCTRRADRSMGGCLSYSPEQWHWLSTFTSAISTFAAK